MGGTGASTHRSTPAVASVCLLAGVVGWVDAGPRLGQPPSSAPGLPCTSCRAGISWLYASLPAPPFHPAPSPHPWVPLLQEALGTTISWGAWALSALVPGTICLLLTPAILYILYPPEVKDTPDAPAKVRRCRCCRGRPAAALNTPHRLARVGGGPHFTPSPPQGQWGPHFTPSPPQGQWGPHFTPSGH